MRKATSWHMQFIAVCKNKHAWRTGGKTEKKWPQPRTFVLRDSQCPKCRGKWRMLIAAFPGRTYGFEVLQPRRQKRKKRRNI